VTAKFDYSAFPPGYYHEVLEGDSPVRRAWHLQKFKRVIDCLPPGEDLALLDVGCFAGSFLSMVDERRFSRQVGVDILPSQIDYANTHFATPHRCFQLVSSMASLGSDLGLPPGAPGRFDCITIIEVIEHLDPIDVARALHGAAELLRDHGTLIVTTPNYVSTWPLLELAIDRLADVSYAEQHITKFNYFNVLGKLRRIDPGFSEHFEVMFKTTTHFISPFLAQISPTLSARVSEWLRHETWRFPLGNLLLMSFRRRARKI